LTTDLSTTSRPASTGLTAADFHQLVDLPSALTWFANVDNPQPLRAY
jgi:hypothetical protein